MIYMTGELNGKPMRLLVLETANLKKILEGKPLVTPDGEVAVCWTPDMVWLADKLADCDGDLDTVKALILESTKRPQKGPRPKHPTHTHRFEKGEDK